MIRLGCLGYGAWGRNVARVADMNPEARLVAAQPPAPVAVAAYNEANGNKTWDDSVSGDVYGLTAINGYLVVSTTDLGFGLARMLSTFEELYDITLDAKAFLSMEEAVTWLDKD